jgi:hypothetical protein
MTLDETGVAPTFGDPAQRDGMTQIVESLSIFGFINLSRLLVKVAPRQWRAGSRPCLRAAAHRVGHFVAGNAVPIAEFLKLLSVKLFGHFPQRVVCRLRVTDATRRSGRHCLV